MEEELHMLRDVYKTAARANLAQEAFWQNMSVKYGFVPEVVPPELMELSRLAAVDYSPNLGDILDDRFSSCLLVINFHFNKIRFQKTCKETIWKFFQIFAVIFNFSCTSPVSMTIRLLVSAAVAVSTFTCGAPRAVSFGTVFIPRYI
jgi:hypothetical protein